MNAGRTPDAREVHLIYHTHTPQRLRRVLLGAACQTRPAATVTVSCDSDNEEIADVCRQAAKEFGLATTVILRKHTGKSRSAQVKNNAVRTLMERGINNPEALLVFFDGDCVPEPAALERHARLQEKAAGNALGAIVMGRRYNLSEAQDAAFDESALRAGRWPITPTEEQLREIRVKDRLYRRQAFLKRFGLAKEHKPKVLGSNFGVRLGAYAAINGHDETYEGWGGEDDDLGRRLYRAGVRPVVGVKEIAVFHQWHRTLAPGSWHEAPNSKRIVEPCETVCARGLRNPVEQPELKVVEIPAGG